MRARRRRDLGPPDDPGAPEFAQALEEDVGARDGKAIAGPYARERGSPCSFSTISALARTPMARRRTPSARPPPRRPRWSTGAEGQSQRRTAGRPGKLDLVPPSAGGGDRRQKRKLGSTPERRRRARAPLVRGHLENREPRHAHVASSPPSPLLPPHFRFDTNGTPLTHELAPSRLLPIELRHSPEIGGGSELAEPVQTETRAARLKLGRPLVAPGLRA